MKHFLATLISFCIFTGSTTLAAVKFPWRDPGKAQIETDGGSATLSNRMFKATFRKAGKGIVFGGMKMTNGKPVAQSGTNLLPSPWQTAPLTHLRIC